MSDNAEAPETDIPLVMATLKNMFRAKGLRYGDIAKIMNISEASVKRYFNGHRLTIQIMERFCQILGVSLCEFYEIAAKEAGAKIQELTEQQEFELGRDPELSLVLVLLLQGWTSDEIMQELEFDVPRMILHLMVLERLGLVKVYPGNRVRLLVGERLKVSLDGPMMGAFNRRTKNEFADAPYNIETDGWAVEIVNLSPGSIARMHEMITAFGKEIRSLAKTDHRKKGDQGHWYTILLSARRTDLREYLRKEKAAMVLP